MKVALTCNTLPSNYSRESGDDTFAEFDAPSTVQAIRKALLNRCDEVVIVEADEDAYEMLRRGNFEFAFNIAEGIRGEAREAQIPAMLEMLGIPYSGSGVTTLAITLDKRRTKEVLEANGIRTPRFQLLSRADELRSDLQFPLFLKPNGEGSSRGITAKSLVSSKEELEEVASEMAATYRQPVLVEEYLTGREFTVGLLGNSPPEVLPIVEVGFEGLPEGAPKFDCYEVKWIYDSLDTGYDTTACPAELDDDLRSRIEKAATRTFEALEVRDLCRLDLRLDNQGEPSVFDVNALPGLIPDPRENSRFPKAAYAAGYSYEELIGKVFNAALAREGISR
ncbi:D-alanine--D-alanine ligase family protein [Methanocrinis sp.]|uniref:D-alanine--D-alanine ligase family protein n=1 Tax=Methanocrinis sp. TaxID=3101522 RepID=UPI003D14FEB6